MIINATSLGLKEDDKFNIDFDSWINKLFYDVIYEPYPTEFSKAGNIEGNNLENGLKMFLYQAQKAFGIWHKILEIDDKVINFFK